MFTQTVEYALRIAVCLANSSPNPQTADDLAETTQVPRAYLAKVIQAMVRGGSVRSKRGVGGGVSLAKSPEELTLLDVINSVDPIKRLTELPMDEKGRRATIEGLRNRCDAAVESVEKIFGDSTLASIVADGEKIAQERPARPAPAEAPASTPPANTSPTEYGGASLSEPANPAQNSVYGNSSVASAAVPHAASEGSSGSEGNPHAPLSQ